MTVTIEQSTAAKRQAVAFGLTPVDLACIAATVAFTVAFMPSVLATYWTPRVVVVLLSLGWGLWALVSDAVVGDRAARLAAAFLAVAGLSAVLSDQVDFALVGEYASDRSFLFVLGFLGIWALGRRLSPRGRGLLVPVLLVCLGASALVGTVQLYADLSAAFSAPVGNRATGLTNNPAYFGALMAGGIGLAIAYLRSARRAWAVLAGLFVYAVALSLSGSRVALVASVLVAGWFVVKLRGWVQIVAPVVLVGGLGLGTLLPGSVNGATRLIDSTASGVTTSAFAGSRLATWEAVPSAVLDAPLIGSGPGRFAPAVGPHLARGYSEATGVDLVMYDAHNLPLHYLVTVGWAGLVLLVAWAWLAARRARAPHVAFVVPIALTWLLQPATLDTVPVALLMLGAASPLASPGFLAARWARPLAVAATCVALVASLSLVLGDHWYQQGVLNGSDGDLRKADNAIPFATVAMARSVLASQQAVLSGSDSDRQRALELLATARDRNPDDHRLWYRLAAAESLWGDRAEAEATFAGSLRLYPWSTNALKGMYALREGGSESPAVAAAADRFCSLHPEDCR